MKQVDIIRMAREAGLPMGRCGAIPLWDRELERFAALVAAHYLEATGTWVVNDTILAKLRADEREACAQLCEYMFSDGALVVADAIRARGPAR
jgi:hypothetical protein